MGRRPIAVLLAAPLAAPLAVAVPALLVGTVRVPGVALAAGVAVLAIAAAVLLEPLVDRAGRRWSVAAAVGLLVPAAATSWATARLLGAAPAARLAWMLGEEDNAHVVGVARELLTVGPRGAELATQYGTSFATPGVALLRAGAVGALSGDARLDAITATTAATALLPLLVGATLLMAATALRASLLRVGARADRTRSSRTGLGGPVSGLVGGLLGGAVVQLLAVALPMQLGFATLAWAMAWTLVGWSALMGVRIPSLPTRTRAALGVQAVLAGVLLEGSWPFLAGALLLPAALLLLPPVLRIARTGGPGRTLRTVGPALLLAGVTAALLAGSGALRTVIGFGREALTAGVTVGASIITVGPSLMVAGGLAALTVLIGVRRRGPVMLTLGAALGAVVTLLLLYLVALAITEGVTGYGGSKLGLASVVLTVGALTSMSAAGALPRLGPALAVAVTLPALVDPLGRTALSWWERTAPTEPPHAVAAVTAIEGSDPMLAIRCRPAPGTPATGASRLAAYFCIVWMEDAFNAERSSGNRFDFFGTEEPTFDGALERARAEGLDSFAYPMRLGPGWFGWDGVS